MRILGFSLIAYATLAYGYITLTPIWQNPDEPAHFNYIAFVARTGGLPTLEPGDWDSALLERLKNGRLDTGDSIDKIRYESWQPPLFYVLAAPVFLLGGDTPAIVLRLRAFNAVLGGLTLIIAYLVARLALQPDVANAVPPTMVGIPMFTAISAAVGADALANLLSAALLLALLRSRSPLLIGALLGLGLLTKLALAMFVPLALIVIGLRSKRRVRESAIMLATAAVLVSPWLVHQVSAYGWADPLAIARHSAVVADQQRFPGLSADYVMQFLTITFHSFWAQFGWMAIVAQPRLYWIWGILSALAAVCLIVKPHMLSEKVRFILLGTVGLSLVAYAGYNLAFEQFQGRYLFTALVPIAIGLVGGWSAWIPRQVQPVAALVLALGLVALNAYTLFRVLVPGFAPTG